MKSEFFKTHWLHFKHKEKQNSMTQRHMLPYPVPSFPEQISHKAVSLIHTSVGGFLSSIGKAYELTLQL